MTDTQVLVCLPTTQTPTVPSWVDRCGSCGTLVWRSQRSGGLLVTCLCLPCFVASVPPGADVRPAPYVTLDLEARK